MNKAKRLLGLLEQEKGGSYEKERASLKKQIDDLHDKLIKMESDPKADGEKLEELRVKLAELTAEYDRMIG